MGQKQFKDLDLNDTVTVEFNVVLVLQAIAEYNATEWAAPAISTLLQSFQEHILDPIFIRERLAEVQHARDQQEAVISRFAPEAGLMGPFPFPEGGTEQ